MITPHTFHQSDVFLATKSPFDLSECTKHSLSLSDPVRGFHLVTILRTFLSLHVALTFATFFWTLVNFQFQTMCGFYIAIIRDHLGLEINCWLTIASIDVVVGHQKTEVEGQVDLKICRYQ